MSDPALLETLHKVRFLEELTGEELEQLASVARIESHSAQSVLFREGETLNRVFLVVEGSVGLYVALPGQGGRLLQTIGSGELLAWSPVLGSEPMTATAVTLTPVRLVALDAAQVLALCAYDPKFGFTFMRHTARALAQRLNATRLHLLDVYRYELPQAPAQAGGPQS